MARVAVARTAVPVAGIVLEDAVFTTMVSGANNGVEIPYRAGDLLVLKNDTVGAAVYTIKSAQPSAYSVHSIVVPDKVAGVAAAKTRIIALDTIWKQADGDIYVDCDIAGKILMMAMS